MPDAARETRALAQGRSRADLDVDRAFLMTLYGELMMIGEAASRVGQANREQMPGIPWQDAIEQAPISRCRAPIQSRSKAARP